MNARGEFRTRRSREPRMRERRKPRGHPRLPPRATRRERRRRDGMKVTEKKGKTILPMSSRARVVVARFYSTRRYVAIVDRDSRTLPYSPVLSRTLPYSPVLSRTLPYSPVLSRTRRRGRIVTRPLGASPSRQPRSTFAAPRGGGGGVLLRDGEPVVARERRRDRLGGVRQSKRGGLDSHHPAQGEISTLSHADVVHLGELYPARQRFDPVRVAHRVQIPASALVLDGPGSSPPSSPARPG